MQDLFRLVRENQIAELKATLNDSTINVRNAEGQSLLQQAIVSQKAEIAKLLISKKINVNNKDLKG